MSDTQAAGVVAIFVVLLLIVVGVGTARDIEACTKKVCNTPGLTAKMLREGCICVEIPKDK